jgi:hypothetical protein
MTDKMAQEEVIDERLRERLGWTASDDRSADLKVISSDDYGFWVSSERLAQHS